MMFRKTLPAAAPMHAAHGVLIAALLLPSAALAQQADPAFLQRAVGVLQTQRNDAFNAAAAQQVRADGLADDLAKAQARIKELEQKPEAPPK
jgi:hypothetical protein